MLNIFKKQVDSCILTFPGFHETVVLAILMWTSPFLGTTSPRCALSLVLVGPAWAGMTVPASTSEKAALHLGHPAACGNCWISLHTKC